MKKALFLLLLISAALFAYYRFCMDDVTRTDFAEWLKGSFNTAFRKKL